MILRLGLVIAALLLTGCATLPRAHTTPVPGWRDYHYRVDLYSPQEGDEHPDGDRLALYSPQIEKRDIVILSSGTVTIDELARSNGGDIIIIADKLVLKAPLDTRVYLNHDHKRFQPTSGGCLAAERYLSPKRMEGFQDFYAWSNDVWDPIRQAYVTAKSTMFPELPFGSTPCVGRGQTSTPVVHGSTGGEDTEGALRLNWGAVKSGDIILYVHDLDVCPGCLPPDFEWNGLKPEWEDSLHSTIDRTLLQARGSRGGRGEVNYWGCEEDALDCGPLKYPGDVPSPSPGKGGAWRTGGTVGGRPGYVEVGFVRNPERARRENDTTLPPSDRSLLGRIGSTRGQSGGDRSIDVNCWTVRDDLFPSPFPGRHFRFHCAPGTGSRTWFVTQQYPSSDSPVKNEQIIAVSPTHMLYQVGSRLNAMTLSRSYLYDDVLIPARSGDYINNLSPSDQFESFLQDAVAEGNDRVLSAAETLSSGAAMPLGAVEPSVLQGLSGNASDYPGFNYQQLHLIERLATLAWEDNPQQPVLSRYFEINGGLARRRTEDPKQDVRYTEMLRKLTSVQESVDRLAPVLSGIHLELFDHFTAEERDKLQLRINQLVAALDEAERKANDDHDLFKKIPKVLSEIQTIVADGRDIATKLYGARPETALTPAGDIVAGIDRLRQVLKGSGVNPDDIRRLLHDAQAAYEAFEQQAEKARAAALARTEKDVAAVVKDRVDLNGLLLSNLTSFDDLLRGTIYQYRSYNSRSDYELNLAGIRHSYRLDASTATNFKMFPMPNCPLNGLSARLEDLRAGTAGGLVDCISNEDVSSTLEVRVRADAAGDATRGLPLAVYSAGARPGVIYLQGRYDVRDLEVVSLSASGGSVRPN